MRILLVAFSLGVVWDGWALSLMTYNVKGNGVSDWSTNSAQVQAIGRVVSQVDADIVTFNEIPASKHWEMTNFVNVYRPGFYLATNSATDGFIRSVIASRYPIAASRSWLARSSLTSFGYAGTFTRDLFEAEIQVPGASEPLQVFAAHLKCCSDTDSKQRRGAEARAISNFFVTVFLPVKGKRPYVLSGDLNEDEERPYAGSEFAVETLTSAPTGLWLTRPVNSITGDERTWSISSLPLSVRFDYVLPCGLLLANTVGSDVFRSDVLVDAPPPLQAGDSATASDHLPVVVQWHYPDPVLQVQAWRTNDAVVVSWPSLVGREYALQAWRDGSGWVDAVTNVVAAVQNVSLTMPAVLGSELWRVVRLR